MQQETGYFGYTSAWLCDADGCFETIPVVTFDFPRVLDGRIPGLTITWSTAYGEWATQFRITAYNSENVVFSRVVDNDNLITVMEGDIQGYTKITLEILKWSVPLRRVRLESIVFGIEKTYGKSEIMDYTATMSVNPLSAELPKSEIKFGIKNLDGKYNPDNPAGAEKYLMERQRVSVKYGYQLEDTVEWIPGGIFYLSEWVTPQNGITATFTARDALEFMTDIYTGETSGTLYKIANAAFEQANLPSLDGGRKCWEIHPYLQHILVPEPVDLKDDTIAEVLQCVANAACCVLYQDRYGVFHIKPLAMQTVDYAIDRFNSYSDSELVLSKPLKAVDINRGTYILPVNRSGETQSITNPFITAEQAPAVADWVSQYLTNRRTLSGAFRADPRLDPLDIITNTNRFSESHVIVTEVKFSYNGAFGGSYKGRGTDKIRDNYRAGEVYAGEV